jgi:hypothetical protein
MSKQIKYKRRIILRSISTAAAISVAGVPSGLLAASQKLDPKDPQAISLGYAEDTSAVDTKKFPKHDKAQTCDACQFYTTAQEGGGRAPCTIFGNRTVAAKGWCSAWVKKTG